MKKLISTLITLSMVLSFAAVPSSAAIEPSTDIYGWSTYAKLGCKVKLVTADTLYGESIEPTDGTADPTVGQMITGNALMLDSSNEKFAMAKTSVAIEKGKTYRLTGKMRSGRSNKDDSNSSVLLTTSVDWANNSTYRLKPLGQIIGAGRTWKNVDYTFTNNTDYGYLAFALTGWGTTVLDDISLKEVITDANGEKTYGPELVTNGDFEYKAPEVTETEAKGNLEGVNGWGSSQWYVAAGKILDAEVTFLTDDADTPEGRGMLKLRAGGATSDYDAVRATAVQKLEGLDTERTYLLKAKVKVGGNNTFLKLTNATIQNIDAYEISGNYGIKFYDTYTDAIHNKWHDVEVEFVPTSSDVEMIFRAQANRTLWLDAVSVKAIEKDSEGNIVKYSEELVTNGNFEDSFKTGMTAGNYMLEDVDGWDGLSNWNIPSNGYEAGVELLENVIGAPQGNNMLKIWAGAPTGTANLNASAIQKLELEAAKTYRLTGKIKYSSNNTYLYIGNSDFNSGARIELPKHFGDNKHKIWNDISIDFTTTDASVEIGFIAAANRTIYIDDLSVKEILFNADGAEIGVDDIEYLVNGNFEGEEIILPVFESVNAFYPSEDGENILDETPQTSLTSMVDEYGVEYVCAQANIKNTKYVEDTITVYLAVYKNGALCDVVLGLAEAVTEETVNVFYKLPQDMADADANYEMKLLVWNDELVPAGACGEITE